MSKKIPSEYKSSVNGTQDIFKEPSSNAIFYSTINNNDRKQEHAKVLEGSQKCS